MVYFEYDFTTRSRAENSSICHPLQSIRAASSDVLLQRESCDVAGAALKQNDSKKLAQPASKDSGTKLSFLFGIGTWPS